MEETLMSRAKRALNAFRNRDPTNEPRDYGMTYSHRQDRVRFSRGRERAIVAAIKTRIAMDVASVTLKHCQLDETGRYDSDINSELNRCLNLEANIDQTGRAFIQDLVYSMLDEGVIAAAPIDTDETPDKYDILSLRTGRVVRWFPQHVSVNLYNELNGQKSDLKFAKRRVAILENPFYEVMNEPNSISQRLNRKLSLLDITDEQTASGKLDLIVQLPYPLKSPAKKAEAEERRKSLEAQLAGSKYGIGYIDATEKVIQLNRSLENNLAKQVESFTEMLYSQMGITQSIMDGTADEQTMVNYTSRTIEPIVSEIAAEFTRKFLTEDARRNREAVAFFRDPFKLIPVSKVAEIADKFTRNEIMSSNEIRQGIGMIPSKDPKADELRNSNINHPDEAVAAKEAAEKGRNYVEEVEIQNG